MENNQVALIKEQINKELANPETLNTLLAVTFKGLNPTLAKRAMLEAMLRGMTLQDFFQKNVYAIPFKSKEGDTYSLVNSIDYMRKVGMKSGVVGTSKPEYEVAKLPDGKEKIVSCTVTIQRKVDEYVGSHSATAYFDEYNTGRQQWASKPRTMIAKVAEMAALRKACPEELAQAFIEEEYDQNTQVMDAVIENKTASEQEYKTKLEQCKDLTELGKVWANMPGEFKAKLDSFKNELKQKYANQKV